MRRVLVVGRAGWTGSRVTSGSRSSMRRRGERMPKEGIDGWPRPASQMRFSSEWIRS